MGKVKRISKKMLNTFIANVADVAPSTIPGDESNDCYYSKIDGSYFTRVGMEEKGFKYLLKRGVTEQLQNINGISGNAVNLGFNPEEQKWVGWSHRAFYSFGIGDTVSQGDCAYQPFDRNDFRKDCIRFWDSEDHENTSAIYFPNGICTSWTYSNTIPNKRLRGTLHSIFSPYPDKWGNGSWEAKTLEDAKIMASDFAEGVS